MDQVPLRRHAGWHAHPRRRPDFGRPFVGPATSNRRAEHIRLGRLRVSLAQGDVRKLHQAPQHAGALFQVASQFNLLEMTSRDVTPEHGVTRYRHDPTQGRACAIAAGAATIYRNYYLEGPTPMGEVTRLYRAWAVTQEPVFATMRVPSIERQLVASPSLHSQPSPSLPFPPWSESAGRRR